MTKALKDIDSNKLGDYLEDYTNPDHNKRLRKFLVLDDPVNIKKILDKAGFKEVNDVDIRGGIAVAEATLAQVNKVLRLQGIDFVFRRFDSGDYDSYMFVHRKENLKATAERVRSSRLTW